MPKTGRFAQTIENSHIFSMFPILSGVFRTFEFRVLTVIDCPKIAGAKAPIAPMLNTPLYSTFVETRFFYNNLQYQRNRFYGTEGPRLTQILGPALPEICISIFTVNNYMQVTGITTGENFAFLIYRHFVEIL